MLLCEERSWDEESDLLIILHGDKRSTHGDFGFTKPNVSTDEPVHSARQCHVVDYSIDSRFLVCGFFEREARRKLVVVDIGYFIGVAFFRLALGVDIEQFSCYIAYFLGSLALGLGPLVGAQ